MSDPVVKALVDGGDVKEALEHYGKILQELVVVKRRLEDAEAIIRKIFGMHPQLALMFTKGFDGAIH